MDQVKFVKTSLKKLEVVWCVNPLSANLTKSSNTLTLVPKSTKDFYLRPDRGRNLSEQNTYREVQLDKTILEKMLLRVITKWLEQSNGS